MVIESDVEKATAAALAWRELCPSYVVCPQNAKLMEKEILRLVDEGHRPENVRTYQIAFSHLSEQLQLNEAPENKRPEEMTPEELSKLSDREKNQLPSPLLKKLADFELKARWAKPQLPEEQELLKQIFEEEGFAPSSPNFAIVGKWLTDRNLEFTPHNIIEGIDQNEAALAPSAQVIDSLTADEYRKQILDPEFRKAQATEQQRERKFPAGVRYSRFVHEG